jgi:hypothetical protein
MEDLQYLKNESYENIDKYIRILIRTISDVLKITDKNYIEKYEYMLLHIGDSQSNKKNALAYIKKKYVDLNRTLSMIQHQEDRKKNEDIKKRYAKDKKISMNEQMYIYEEMQKEWKKIDIFISPHVQSYFKDVHLDVSLSQMNHIYGSEHKWNKEKTKIEEYSPFHYNDAFYVCLYIYVMELNKLLGLDKKIDTDLNSFAEKRKMHTNKRIVYLSEFVKMIVEEIYEDQEFFKDEESFRMEQEMLFHSYEFKSRFYKKDKVIEYVNENTNDTNDTNDIIVTEEMNVYSKRDESGEMEEKIDDKELYEDIVYRKEIEETIAQGVKEDVDYGDMSEYDIEGD